MLPLSTRPACWPWLGSYVGGGLAGPRASSQEGKAAASCRSPNDARDAPLPFDRVGLASTSLADRGHAICAPAYPLAISRVMKSLKTSSMILTNYVPNRASGGEHMVARSRCVGARLFLSARTKKLETFPPSRRASDVREVTGGLPLARRHDSMIL